MTGIPVTPADSNAASEMDTDDKGIPIIEDSRAAKWNLKIDRPKYSDDEYENHLKDGNWSKEETDYLMDLATDYDLRWVIIGDRYDYKPPQPPQDGSSEAMAIDQSSPHSKSRTIEDLKARYYAVAARCMTFRTPLSSMNPSEFETHEKMIKFDSKRETMRKQYAEKLFLRTPEEAHEEELLLKELSRIVINQEKLYQERKALYERLEAPRSMNSAAAHASTTVYQSSQGLHQLMQNMMQSQRLRESERREKRRSALGIDTENANSQNNADNRGPRSSLGSASATHEKRQPHPTPQHRPLSHAERIRFGVSYPQERLTSGVQFRHERVLKASQAKSTVQTTRINDALAELGIPPRLLMPTNKVVTEYERLVEGVKTLVEVRKLREKVDGEIKVWEAQKNLANGDGAGDQHDGEAAKTEDAEAEADEDEHQDEPKQEEKSDSDDENDKSRVNDEDDEDEEDEEGGKIAAEEAGPNADGDAEDEDEDEDGEDGDNNDAEVENEDQDEEGALDDEGSDETQGPEQKDDDDSDDDEGEEDEEEQEEAKVVKEEKNHEDRDENEDENGSPSSDADQADSRDNIADEEDAADDEDDGAASARVQSSSIRKRSASVISAVSNKSSKRQRK